MTSYATLAELKTYINDLTGGVQSSFSAGEDALLQTFLNEATAEIDRQAGRHFIAVGDVETPSTRYYWPEDVTDDVLYLDDDLMSVATLTNGDGTVIPSNGYWLQPDNTTAKSKIKLKSSYSWDFDTDGRIAVAGIWGFSATAPADIKRATKRLAYFYWMKRTATGEATVLNETTTQDAAEYPADVMSVFRRYKRGMVR